MDDNERALAYELHISDMLMTLNERLNELESEENLSDFDKGRKLAYEEILDIIKTRHEILLETISDD